MLLKVLRTIKNQLISYFMFANICKFFICACICNNIYKINNKKVDGDIKPPKNEVIVKQPESKSNDYLTKSKSKSEDDEIFNTYFNIDIKDIHQNNKC